MKHSLANSLIIIPTYNEVSNVEKMIHTLNKLYCDFDLLFVDDHSPDGTGNLIEINQKSYSNLYLLNRTNKSGLASAYQEAFHWAKKRDYNYIFQMDCDFSHNPEDLIALLKKCINDEVDSVIGSRYLGGIRILNWPIKKLLLSYMANFYARVTLRLNLFDLTSGFKCFKASAIRQVDLKEVISNGYAFQIEVPFKMHSMGLKLVEYPIVFTERKKGHSKMNYWIIFEAFILVLRLKLQQLLKF